MFFVVLKWNTGCCVVSFSFLFSGRRGYVSRDVNLF